MQNKTISFETAEAAVMQTWKSLLKQTNPYLVPILLPMIEHFKPLFQEFYDLGVSHGRTAQAVPEWISVKDNLPPENILVLGMSQTRSNIFNVYNVMALDEFEEAEVTHWMPLPDAPQEPAND